LSVLESHFPIKTLLKCDSSYLWHVALSVCIGRASCVVGGHGWSLGRSALQYVAVGALPLEKFEYDIHICRFWCILTHTKS